MASKSPKIKKAYAEKFVKYAIETGGKGLGSLGKMKKATLGRYDVLTKLAAISYNLKGSAKFSGNLNSTQVLLAGYPSFSDFKSRAGKAISEFITDLGLTTGTLSKDMKILQRYSDNYANVIIAYKDDAGDAESQQVFQYQWDKNQRIKGDDGNFLKGDDGKYLKKSIHFKERAINGKSLLCSFNDAIAQAASLGNIDFILLIVSTPEYADDNADLTDVFLMDMRKPIKPKVKKLTLEDKIARHKRMVRNAKSNLARSGKRLNNLMTRRQIAMQGINQYQMIQNQFANGNMLNLSKNFYYITSTPEYEVLSDSDKELVNAYANLANKGKYREARYVLRGMEDKTFASAILNDTTYKGTLAMEKRKLALRKKINALADKYTDKISAMETVRTAIDEAKATIKLEKDNEANGLGVDMIALTDAQNSIKKLASKYNSLKKSSFNLKKQIKMLRERLGTYKKMDAKSMEKKNAIVQKLTNDIRKQEVYGVSASARLKNVLQKLNKMDTLTPAQKQIVKQQVVSQVADGSDITDAVQAAVQQMPMQATVGQMAGVWDF